MIAGGRVLAREDDIAVGLAVGDAAPLPHFFPFKFARFRDRARHVEPPAMRFGRHAPFAIHIGQVAASRSEEHTSELQSLMRISYAVFCLKNKKNRTLTHTNIKTRKNIYNIQQIHITNINKKK